PEERALVQTGFKNAHIPSGILGIGPDAPPWHEAARFRERYAPRGPVVLYLGQISEGKAVDELVADWVAYREGGGKGTLLLAGTQRMTLPHRDDIVSFGHVSEEDKCALLEAADALVLPSHLQSLGIVILEAWQVGTPCLVSRRTSLSRSRRRRRRTTAPGRASSRRASTRSTASLCGGFRLSGRAPGISRSTSGARSAPGTPSTTSARSLTRRVRTHPSSSI